jgi:hypothetical protein
MRRVGKNSKNNRTAERKGVASVASSGGGMSKFLEDSKFFWTEYHSGRVNIILHLVSFSFLFYGLAVKSVALVVIGLFVFDEMGHAYNYFFVHKRDPKFALRMIPYQLLYGSDG